MATITNTIGPQYSVSTHSTLIWHYRASGVHSQGVYKLCIHGQHLHVKKWDLASSHNLHGKRFL